MYLVYDSDKGGMICTAQIDAYRDCYLSEKKRVCVPRADDCYFLLGGYSYTEGERRLCVTEEECFTNYDGSIIFDPVPGGTSEIRCVSPTTCMAREEGYFAFANTMECAQATPAPNGGFDEGMAKRNLYGCGDKYLVFHWDGQQSYAKCVKKDECDGVIFESKKLCT